MSISIDLHVKCPFYKKQNKKKFTIFPREISTWYLGSKKLYPTKILSQGVVKKHFKCAQFTRVHFEGK